MNGRRTSLITGASSGFGVEFAKLFARDGYDLVLVARSEPPMRELADSLAKAHAITATVIAKDLAAPHATEELVADLGARGIQVDALVNNAGFAQYGPFVEADPGVLHEMVSVNVVALTELTRRCCRAWSSAGGEGSCTSGRSARSRPPP
ncbi:MAG: SDR family NAD(P)-dependent oxidoreductase [Actinomycetota bacterium]